MFPDEFQMAEPNAVIRIDMYRSVNFTKELTCFVVSLIIVFNIINGWKEHLEAVTPPPDQNTTNETYPYWKIEICLIAR